jgi:hypothetical protein
MIARKKKQAPPRRLSRRVLAQMLADLCGRLKEQVEVAEAIAKVAAPTDQTISGAWPMLKVIEIAAIAHESDLRQAHEFAKLFCDKVA